MRSGNIFAHSGDIGDMVYGLVVMKLLGGGGLVLEGQHSLAYDLNPRVGFTREGVCFVTPLLLVQPYVQDVSFVQRCAYSTHDLNRFRLHWRRCRYVPYYEARGWMPPYSLQRMHLAAFGLVCDEREPWIVAEPEYGPRVLFARSARYHNDSFPWQRVVDKYRDRACFVGFPDEHEAFCGAFGSVKHLPVRDALHLAGLMKGASLVVANQSAVYAIAEGLKIRTIQETRVVPDDGADCVFDRPNAQFVRDGTVELPNV